MKRSLKFLLLFLFASLTFAQQQPDLQQQLPVDPNVQIGKLPNGFEYWIRSHKTPPGKISMWLHVDSGSLNEEESQRGLAHFLEHMAFNGSEHYPPGTLVKYFESIGLRFGQHQNAFTSFDQTTYTLSLPDTKEETVQKGLETLADFAFRITLDPEEIEKERSVILAEARARKGVGQRVLEKILPILLPGSLLANRIPIGTEDVIRKSTRQDFVNYYQKWYRPDNSTLLVVGDMEASKVAELIRDEFDEWKPVSSPPEDVEPGIKPYTATQAEVITDPELTTAEVSSINIGPLSRLHTAGQFRTELVEDLATSIVNRRLLALIEEGKAPYQEASLGIAPFQNKYLIKEAQATGAPDQWKPILNTLLTEIKRARDFGFLESELEDAKKSILASTEQSARTEQTWDATVFLNRMNSAVSQGRKPMSQSQALDLTRTLLTTITLQETTSAFKTHFSTDSRLLLVTLPDKQEVPTKELILAEAERVEKSTVQPLLAKERPTSLLEKEPQPGKIAQQEEDADTQILSATLENGVRIHLRKMDFKKNSVTAIIRVMGGEIQETEKNRGITQVASLPFAQPATKKYSSTTIREFMTGKNAGVSGGAGGDNFLLAVSGSPDDFEEGFRLAHLLLKEPKVEDAALRVWREESLQAIEQQKTSVEDQAFEKRDELLTGGDPRMKSLTVDQVNAIQVADAQKWLESIIESGPIEVAIVGDMDRDRMLQLSLKYLGSLSTRKRISDFAAERKVKIVPGPLQSKIEVSTITPRAIVLTGWRGTNFPEVKDRRALDLAAQILTSRMQEEIREKRGLTYSVSCMSIPATVYPETGFFGAVFTADPEKTADAEKIASDMMMDLATKGPSDAEIQTVRNQMRNVLETQQKEPGYWLRILSELDFRGIRLEDVKTLVPVITSYTREDILAALNRYLVPTRKIEVVAFPKVETKK